LSGQFYDVIIVGAGPAGSYAAYELSSRGHDVAVFEQKSAPGLDVCCTGIISAECFDSFGISADVILTRTNSAKFFSPSGKYLRLQTEKVQAYIVDRLSFDRALASKAQSRGAHYYCSSQVVDITLEKDSIEAETLCSGTREIFTARTVILANGFTPKLTQRLGMGKIRRFLIGAQAKVETKALDGPEVYFGREVAPGSFAWLVPISANTAYAGLLSTSQAKLQLQKFLLTPFCQGRIVNQEVEIRQRAIPLGILSRSYGNRVLVIGDAAGQVKPTTGGGIYFGHLGARIAVNVLDEALSSDKLTAERLGLYQKQWKAKMGKELAYGYWARWAYARLGDHQIERMFNIIGSGKLAGRLLNSSDFSFDWHSRLILASLRYSSAYPLVRIKHLLSPEASS